MSWHILTEQKSSCVKKGTRLKLQITALQNHKGQLRKIGLTQVFSMRKTSILKYLLKNCYCTYVIERCPCTTDSIFNFLTYSL